MSQKKTATGEFLDPRAFGELLDLQGPIGGLNFQAAFATAELAAADAVRALHAG